MPRVTPLPALRHDLRYSNSSPLNYKQTLIAIIDRQAQRALSKATVRILRGCGKVGAETCEGEYCAGWGGHVEKS